MKILKNIYFYLIILLFGVIGCKKDNYTSPQSVLTGSVNYQGTSIGLRSNGVQLELWQHGYAFFSKIPIYVNQDGSFKATLFDGNYLLTRQRGIGPWIDNTDSISVTVKGNTVIDVPVTPYYLVKDATFQKSGSSIKCTINVSAITTSKALETVKLYLFKTALIDDQNQNASSSMAGSAITDLNQPLNMSVNIPSSLTNEEAIYARVGVKTVGVTELAYSSPQRISLK
ncbi:MAG: DUF3823 domain-containing protein [Pelobium sp.]